MQAIAQTTISIQIIGIVQGVGARPAIKRLADKYRLRGWVRNTGNEVQLRAQGEPGNLKRFQASLAAAFPQQSVLVQARDIDDLGANPGQDFVIESSLCDTRALSITPDFAVCDKCRAELFDQANRRYHYPFTSCTQCGSRYSISTSAPFDRERTTLQAFTPCRSCSSEFSNPADRRYHAQTIACQACGPQINLLDPNGKTIQLPGPWQDYTRQKLSAGGVIAIKTAGGFQLYALASNSNAVKKIRDLKHRPHKPLALLMAGIGQVEQYCQVNSVEKALLCSPAAPLVLLHSQTDVAGIAKVADFEKVTAIAENVTPGNPYYAAMLAHHPLQHLLLHAIKEPLVATSANRSGEALIADDANLLEAFTGRLDLIITHNLPIHRALDDSIFQVIGDRPMCLRAGRGVAPIVIGLDQITPQKNLQSFNPINGMLALGAQLKNSIALSHNNELVLSQYHGDLENISILNRQQQSIDEYKQLNAQPLQLIVDKHPQRQAIADSLPASRIIEIQHHEAHARACQLEHAINEPHLAVVWDGFGYGTKNCIWGSEFYLIHDAAITPFAHFSALKLLGGDMAMREPRRMALAALWPHYGEESFNKLDAIWGQELFSLTEHRLLLSLQQKPGMTTRAAGRWFDAIAGLLGISQLNRFEADAAMQLQYVAEQATESDEAYAVDITRQKNGWEINCASLVEQILLDQDTSPLKALRFHNSLVATIINMAGLSKVKAVSLSGGCFQNRLLLKLCQQQLERRGIRCYWPEKIPANDGGIAAGQIFAALLSQENSLNQQHEQKTLCV